MGVGKEKDKDRGLVRGSGCNCMEIKILIMTILAMGIMVIASQIFPFGGFSSGSCEKLVGKILQKESGLQVNLSRVDNMAFNSTAGPAKSEELPSKEEEEEESKNKQVFRAYGRAAYLFIQMGAYRGGANTFAVVGLASKPLHVYGKPGFECEWIPGDSTLRPVKGKALKILPDWGYGRVYTVVVVNCTFAEPVGDDGGGGQLILYANNGQDFEHPERILALNEKEKSYNASVFTGPPPYDYLYCGSSLYGDLNPQRMREWIAYHAKFFGARSHFVFHDAGGVNSEVREVLEPWIQAGRVTLQDIRDQEQFDGYYHNQFLIVNDCLHRYKFMAKWTFFFDVDEFLYISRGRSIDSIVQEYSGYTQFTIQQYHMSDKICLDHSDSAKHSREWVFEKLVFRDVAKGIRRDRKYAVQARNVEATGVHMSENFHGKKKHTMDMIRYYHYHNTLSNRKELCRIFVKPSMKGNVTWIEGTPYVYDGRLKALAPSIKQFEIEQIGSKLASTAQ
ncbi:hypothetical protein SUGI_0799880 [Cryptomeria japonica]|uniref:galactan beta-1,4-galactosyltransferase GALS1 n=1 Tax=Cryptomeria japonica TaxID=3369 RepID=UPI002414706D|nr:galactan beta-1,4-galactosyltransferase GALS1 [Cryptomeria japonica]GLJ39209.1 hypothetical protein SUGI_0799880 [Cryptomeria japonica]